MSAEREQEFEELRAYLDFFATHVLRVDPASAEHPANALEPIIQRHGRSGALAGLRQGVNDAIESMRDIPAARRKELDEEFRSAGVASLSEMQRRYDASYRRIVQRGSIRNDTDYHLINGIVVDTASQMTDEERARLHQLIEQYEGRM
jgi:hypothetical protein